MKPVIIRFCVSLLFSFLFYACKVTTNVKVDELFAAWNSNKTPGAAIAVVKDGSIIYKKGYGSANLEYNIPVTPSTIFHIASVSKQFTAFSILLLEKEGKLSLEDDVRKYIPEVPDFGKVITLKHLASHTSGLRDQWNLLALAGWRLDDVITKEHILKLVSRQKELNFDPGNEFLYCNTGFTLLAEVVSRVSGQPFSAFTDQNIFKPLKMSNTLFYDDHEKIVKNRAYSYYSDNNGYKKRVLSYANVGATSLFTTVEDLSLWAMNFSSLKVGDAKMIDKMNAMAVLNNGETFGGALGQFVGKYKGLNEIQHGGADAGYRSYLGRFPDQNFAVIVFSNDASFRAGILAHKLADIYLETEFVSESTDDTKTGETSDENVSVDPETLNTYVGAYELQPGFTINITANNGELFGQATNQQKVLLKPLSTTRFSVEGIEAVIAFFPDSSGKVTSLKLHQNGQIMDATRAIPFDKSAVNLAEFTGQFYSPELSTTYSFTHVGDKLMAQHDRLSNIQLNPVKKDMFSGSVWFFGQAEFTRDSDGLINGCKVSSGRVRNLWFRKVDSLNTPSRITD
ncbi:MAG: serine hydrolase [Cytophagales bacterium]|nr:serine hydrolase [Cytophagales bacterium]